MSYNLLLNEAFLTKYVVPGSLSLNESTAGRSTLSLSLIGITGFTDKVVIGKKIELNDIRIIDYNLVTDTPDYFIDYGLVTDTPDYFLDYDDLSSGVNTFGGVIDNINVRYADGMMKKAVVYDVNAVDWQAICDRILVAKVFQGKTFNYIINELYNEYLYPEGIILGTVTSNTDIINYAVFNYDTLSVTLDKIASAMGYIWWIDYDKTFNFTERNADSALWPLTNTSPVLSIVVSEDRANYRNKQTIIGRSTTDLVTETFTVVDTETTWNLAFEVIVDDDHHEPIITINGTPATVGIRETDEDYDFYYIVGDKSITTEFETGIGDVIIVQYYGTFDILAQAISLTEINNRKTDEGGTGKYEAIENRDEITTYEGLNEIAEDKIEEFGAFGKTVNFTTYNNELQSGQLMNIDLPDLGINDTDMLITDINAQENQVRDNILYSVKATTSNSGSWTKFFRDWMNLNKNLNLGSATDKITIRVNEITDWDVTASPNIFTRWYADGTVLANGSKLACFTDYLEEVIIELVFDDASIFRKGKTKQYRTADQIKTIFNVILEEGAGNITNIKFYGGFRASNIPSTGILLDSKAYTHTKTNQEILQVVHFNNKL